MKATQAALLSLALALGATTAVRAHSDKHHPNKAAEVRKEQKDWGIAGDPKAVTLTIKHSAKDSMRFSRDLDRVKLGDTVRFVIHNDGKIMHEFVIGTVKENQAHAELMKKFPNMEHDEPYMVHVPPGKTAEIIWTFNRPGEFEFACLIAGHYDAGMKGMIKVGAMNVASR
jgi:uncharacterized cupredoxin-like copper-binding protein